MKNLKDTMNLALIMSIADYTQDLKPGRLKGMLDKLRKETETALSVQPPVMLWEKGKMAEVLNEFGNEMKWFSRKHDLAKIVSFVLDRIDGSFPKITKILMAIYDYLDRAGGAAFATDQEGREAAEAFERIFMKHFPQN